MAPVPPKRTERKSGGGSRGSQVYEALIERIRSGELNPGTRIREEDVGALLGVSRTPVREALARLQARGLLENADGGLTIARFSHSKIMELYAMRIMLEGAAARFAAENASSSEVANLRRVGDLFANFQGDAGAFARANSVLHAAIYEAAHNHYLMRMLEDLNDSVILLPSTTFSVAGRAEAAKIEHKKILAAIEARDADGAEQTARQHIHNALDARLEMLFALR